MKSEPAWPTTAGVKVRSHYEQTCADYLHNNRVRFQYEPLILLGGRQFRPDFYLPDFNLFLEICGYGHMPYYRGRITHKKQVYRRHQLHAVFINYNGRGSLTKLIRAELECHGVTFVT